MGEKDGTKAGRWRSPFIWKRNMGKINILSLRRSARGG